METIWKRGGREVDGGRREMEEGIRELNWKVEEERKMGCGSARRDVKGKYCRRELEEGTRCQKEEEGRWKEEEGTWKEVNGRWKRDGRELEDIFKEV